MKTIGGWFVESYELEPEEEKLDSFAAIYHRGDERPWGGRLHLTDARLIFVPNVIDRFRDGRSFTIDLMEIGNIEIIERGEKSSRSKLLEFTLDDGRSERFHTKKMKKVRDQILEVVEETAKRSNVQ